MSDVLEEKFRKMAEKVPLQMLPGTPSKTPTQSEKANKAEVMEAESVSATSIQLETIMAQMASLSQAVCEQRFPPAPPAIPPVTVGHPTFEQTAQQAFSHPLPVSLPLLGPPPLPH